MAKPRPEKVLLQTETHVTLMSSHQQVYDIPVDQYQLRKRWLADIDQYRREHLYSPSPDEIEFVRKNVRLESPMSFGTGPTFAPGLIVHYLEELGQRYWVFDRAGQFIAATADPGVLTAMLRAEAGGADPDRRFLRKGARELVSADAEAEALAREAHYIERDKVETAKFRADMANRDRAKQGGGLSMDELTNLLGL